MNKQRGGAIIGLIIGLVIGLGVAVVVAMMITKTSTPFTNKLGMTKPAEVSDIQLTDPNKPLYGNSYKEAPLNSTKLNNSANSANPFNPSTTSVPKPEEVNAKETAENTVKYPDVENAPELVKFSSKSVPSSEEKRAGTDKAAYYLQVGAFRDRSDAENVRAKLALIDVESNVGANNSENDSLYRVRIGPFNSLDEMNRMRSKLVENSIDVAVIKTPK